MAIRLKITELKAVSVWNRLVQDCPGGSVFHSTEWLKSTGKNYTLYGIYNKDQLIGGLPVTWYSSCFGNRTTMPPLTPYLGPFWRDKGNNPAKKNAYNKRVLASCADFLKERYSRVTLKFSPEVIDMQPFIWRGFKCGLWYTYRLKLSDLDQVWENFCPTRRNDIRKAQRDGFLVEPAEFSTVFSLVEASFSRQDKKVGFSCQAKIIDRTMAPLGKGKGFVARDQKGRALASAYLVVDNKRVYYLLGGYDPQLRHHGAGALLLWELIRFSKKEWGVDEFDFEGSMIPAVERYFRDFGGRLTPFYTLSWALAPWWKAMGIGINRYFKR